MNSSGHLLRKQWSALSLDDANTQWQDSTTTTRNNAQRSGTSTTQHVTRRADMLLQRLNSSEFHFNDRL